MTKIVITIEDTQTGEADINFQFEPAITKKPVSEYTEAETVALFVLNALNETGGTEVVSVG